LDTDARLRHNRQSHTVILDIRRAAVCVGFFVTIMTPTYARAVDLHNVLTGYALSSWTEGDSRSLGGVSAIVQDLSGYLWLGTDIGLVRFDGWRFTRWETTSRTPLPRSPIVALCAARDGTLWIGFADGAVGRIKDTELFVARPANGDDGPVMKLTEDHNGTIWTVVGGTVRRLRAGRWEKVALEKGSPAPSPVAVMVRAIGDHVWIGSRYDLYQWIEESDTFQKVLNLGAVDVAEDASQRLWITDFNQGFRLATGAGRTAGLQGTGLRLLSDRRGNLWVATIGEGLWRVQIDGREQPIVEKASLNTGLLSDSIQAITEDREGNIWIGTTGGLQRLTERTFTPVANVGWVTALEADARTVWAGTNNGLFRLTSGSDRWRREPKQPSELWVRSVHVDRRGALWVGSDRMIFRMVEDRLEPLPLPPRISFGPIDSLTSDSFGSIWFSDGPRLFRWQHGHLAQIDVPFQTGEGQIALLYADSADRLWIAFREGSIGVLDAATGQPREMTGITDVAHQTVLDIFEDASHVIWFLGNRSLTKFSQGRFVTLTHEQRMPPTVLGAIIGDGSDELWLNTNSGLLRLSQKAFETAVDDPSRPLQYQLYDTADGVAGAPIVKLLARRDASGRLWFARGGALTSVTPTQLADTLTPLPQSVRIESVVTDDGAVSDLSRSVLSSSTRRLEINYTALTLTAPNKIRFRYRLDGFDADWVDAGTRRQAFYTNLAPGPYVFRVEASATDGRWGNSSAAWRFRRKPRFVQTGAFYLGSAVLLSLFAIGIWKLRLRMVHREFAAVLAERLRLSRELHDTLLQNLVGLALQFDVLADGVGTATADARYRLVRIRKQVEGYVREARQSVYELRSPSPPSCPDLATSLTEFGAQTASGTLEFESHVEGDPPECSAKVRRAVTRIGQEAITNAVRHADARRIRLDLRFEPGAIALRVADDGCGFDVERVQSAAADHYGLVSMRERAEDIGAQLDMTSEKGRGTIVQLRAPLLDD
jgi:signal transduction histidine kinase/ligand-binding sensor domain-containing protein